MKRLIVAAALVAAGFAVSAGVLVMKSKGSGMELRLLDTPCSHGESLAELAEEWRPKFKNARVINPKGFIEEYGCWIQHDDNSVALILGGVWLQLPLAAFVDPVI